MKQKVFIFCALFLVITLLMGGGKAAAFNAITAQEAYDMVISGEATIIDVRTAEEFAFVGSAALEAGGNPIAYLIPWLLFEGIDDNGQRKYKNNPDFDALIEQTFDKDKEQVLIMMCASGIRSTYAAERLEMLGYPNVYEIDDALKEMTEYPGGHGGFQGSLYNDMYNGYKGYPDRLSLGMKTVDSDNEDISVSWLDTGLPITFKIDPARIPKLKKQSVPIETASSPNYQGSVNSTSWNYSSYSNQSPYSGFGFQSERVASFVPQQTWMTQNLFSYPLIQSNSLPILFKDSAILFSKPTEVMHSP
ncbi:MAG: rhodanese-like domain-containing protein [bacterium]